MQKNYFQGTRESPTHLSIGGVLQNEKGEIACHYFKHLVVDGKEGADFYVLMRETIEPNEPIESCLMRGFQEEFGAEVRLEKFLGSIVCQVQKEGFSKEKTTLYFLCSLISIEESRRKDGDPERGSEVRWMTLEDIIPKMKEQAIRLDRMDIDESKILEKLRV